MDFALPGDDDPRRQQVRSWLEAHPEPSPRELAEAGYVAPHWPRPWGLEADPITQLLIDEEIKRAGISRPFNMIGTGWAGPTILHAGSQEQKDRYLMPILTGEEMWCQLFSEPEAGSDLANLSTRAVREGDHYVINGQKIWTSLAHESQLGILLARTDPSAPKHEGISYFICPMDTPGITIRPILDMTGMHSFNEVFLENVRLPASNLVGEENKGWSLAKVTLGNERVSISGRGAIWGQGSTAADLIEVAKSAGGLKDPAMRQRLAKLYIESEILRLIILRTVTAAVRGEQPGPEASVRKLLSDEHGKRLLNLAKDLAGAGGMLANRGPLGTEPGWWDFGFLFTPAITLAGGTAEVQRNILAERVLGLPREVDPDEGVPWSERGRQATTTLNG